jgi:iron complex transport system substrate-binding protein
MKRKIFTATALIFALAFALALAACGDAATNPRLETVEYDTPLTFDNYGREITLTHRPQKVLTLGPNCTELFIALGLTDYITGHSLADHSRGPLPEYAADYAKIPELTYSHATREAVITSGADFIYGIDWEFGGGIETEELADYGITVYMNAAKTLEQIYREILDIGRIFQIEERAEAFIADQNARIEAVQEKILPMSYRPKVLVYDHGSAGVFTAGGTNFASLLIDLAGGRNIFGDMTEREWFTVSYEEVLAREPDVIIIHDYDVPSVEEKIAEIKGGILSQLDAVQNERFVIIELESVLPGSRMAHTTEIMAAGFYPGLFE